ncbi:hypothetical protein MJD09_10645 [bacterium]|nr:hypothetical protein [bacterium]
MSPSEEIGELRGWSEWEKAHLRELGITDDKPDTPEGMERHMRKAFAAFKRHSKAERARGRRESIEQTNREIAERRLASDAVTNELDGI